MSKLDKMKPLPPLVGVAGLGNVFKDAADTIAEVKASGTSLGVEAKALATDIETVRQHVRREHEDFHFKVGTLGNSGGGQSEQQEKSPGNSSAEGRDTVSSADREKQEVTDQEVGQLSSEQ